MGLTFFRMQELHEAVCEMLKKAVNCLRKETRAKRKTKANKTPRQLLLISHMLRQTAFELVASGSKKRRRPRANFEISDVDGDRYTNVSRHFYGYFAERWSW
jgi:hypothetical protein